MPKFQPFPAANGTSLKWSELWSSILLPCLALALAMTGVGFYAYDATKKVVRENIANDMRAIAKLKVGQIEQWLAERRDDTQLIATSQFSRDLQQWIEGGMHDNQLKQRLLEQLRIPDSSLQHRAFSLRSPHDGATLLTTDNTADTGIVRRLAMQSALLGKVLLEDIHFTEENNPGEKDRPRIDIGFFTPLFSSKDGHPQALLHLRMNPEEVLYPLLQVWPGVSESAETLLLRKEAENAIYLNDLRHIRNSALRLSAPLTQTHFIAARVINEGEGFFEDNDYRGVPSLAYGISVPGTPWVLVAKIDRDEAYKQLNIIAALVSGLCFVLLLICALWLFERKRKELRLSRLFVEGEDLYQNAPCGYHSLDKDGMILRINETHLTMLGYTREEVIGKMNIRHLLPEASLRKFQEYFAIVTEFGKIKDIDFELIRKDGSIMPVLVSASAIKDSHGQFLMSRSILFDLTERKQGEEKLRLLQSAIESSLHALIITAVTEGSMWRIIYVNPAFERITGYKAEEVLGKSPGFLQGNEQDQPGIAEFDTAIRENRECQVTLRNFRKDGTLFWNEMRVSPVLDERGKTTHHVGIISDVTARKGIEAELIESREQLRKLALHDDGVREEERKHIARELHDELGQMLTVLKMNISLLQMRYDEIPGLVEMTEEMRTLVENTISVVRNAVSDLRPAALDLGIVGALEWLAEDFTQHTGIGCTYEGERDEPILNEMLATAVFRIAQESLTNVARHASASHVSIQLACGSDKLHLSINDDGHGFDPVAVAQGNNNFGLLGMQERVTMLHGRFEIQSIPGKGTRVIIELPLTKPKLQ